MAQGNYAEEPKIVFPGPLGGHNWQGMAYSPQTRWVYLPAHDVPLRYVDDEQWLERPGGFKPGVDLLSGYDGIPEYVGYLLAWDPFERKIVWRNQLAGYWNGGVLATGGGLVFQGAGDGSFVAFDARSGDEVWRVDHTTGFMAPPIAYEIDGTQYISIAAGWGGAAPINGIAKGSIVLDYHNENRILTFKLQGDLAMPISRKRDKTPVQPPTSTASPEQIARGEYQYNYMCSGCHGTNLESAMVHPDLRFTGAERHAVFNQIVLEGLLMNNGMPSFAGELTGEQAEDIHAYVIDTAQEFYAVQSTGEGVD
jgi:mono/diheme cytochrome c family protein